MKKLKYIYELGIIKTLYFNLNKFGLKGLKLPILISKSTKILDNSGEIILERIKFGDIKIGFSGVGVFDYKYQRTLFQNTGKITFKEKANIGLGSRIVNAGELEIGKQFNITACTTIICYKNIRFGNNVLISWENLIMDTDFHKIKDIQNKITLNLNKAIVIKDNVWIGCRNTILKGTYIDNYSVIASNSLVNASFKNNSNIIIGDKNKIIKRNIYWEA